MMPPAFPGLSLILVLLALSIGWDIRGDYGYEAGGMMLGALAAIAPALISGREN